MKASSYSYPGSESKYKPDHLIEKACKSYGVTFDDLRGSKRTQIIAEARFYAMYLIKKNTTFTQKKIGRMFRRDHATVIHAVKTISDRIETGQTLVDL